MTAEELFPPTILFYFLLFSCFFHLLHFYFIIALFIACNVALLYFNYLIILLLQVEMLACYMLVFK